jgi:hypothetical protein
MNTERPDDGREFDAAVERAWHEASSETPPTRADAAILAAAKSPRSRSAAWQPLAAAASVAGLAFLLIQLMPREREPAAPAQQESAAPMEQPAVPAATAGVAPTSPPEANKAQARSSERESVAAPTAARPEAGLAGTADAAAPPLTPVAWADRIARLHDAGNLDDAARELRAFRASVPDADRYIPDALRDWAAAIE